LGVKSIGKLKEVITHSGLLVAGAAAFSMSTLFSAMKPVLLTRFVEETGSGESLAGLVVAMPFAGIAAASLVLKPVLRHLGLHQMVLVFGGMLILLELFSAFFFNYHGALLIAQFIGGVSVGVLMGATSRIVATTDLPDEIFGFVDMSAVFLMSFMIAGVGAAVGLYGLQGGYLFAALAALIYTALMLPYQEAETAHFEKKSVVAPLEFGIRPLSVIFMGVLFVTSSGLGFAFLFTKALDLGMGYSIAGSFIGGLVLVSAFACLVGGWCGGRFGPFRPLAAAFITCALGWWVAINAHSQLVFMLALVPAIFSLQFNFPVLLALAGSLDVDGRWAAVATPLITSGFAWAAIAAGLIVSQWDVAALGTATVVGMFVCLLLLVPSRP